MKNCDKLSVITAHFFGFSLKQVAEIFEMSIDSLWMDRSRHRKIWQNGYGLIYQEQIAALEYTVAFLKEVKLKQDDIHPTNYGSFTISHFEWQDRLLIHHQDAERHASVANIYQHLAVTHKNLAKTILLTDKLPKQFNPPCVVTQALVHQLPEALPPLPIAKKRIMIEFPAKPEKAGQKRELRRYRLQGTEIARMPTDTGFYDNLSERFKEKQHLLKKTTRTNLSENK